MTDCRTVIRSCQPQNLNFKLLPTKKKKKNGRSNFKIVVLSVTENKTWQFIQNATLNRFKGKRYTLKGDNSGNIVLPNLKLGLLYKELIFTRSEHNLYSYSRRLFFQSYWCIMKQTGSR